MKPPSLVTSMSSCATGGGVGDGGGVGVPVGVGLGAFGVATGEPDGEVDGDGVIGLPHAAARATANRGRRTGKRRKYGKDTVVSILIYEADADRHVASGHSMTPVRLGLLRGSRGPDL